MKIKKIITALALIIATLIFSEAPFIYGSLISTEEETFINITQQNPGDDFIYLNYIRQAKDGVILFENFFTSERQFGLYFSPFWLMLGKITAMLNIQETTTLQASKMLFAAIFLATLLYLISKVFTKKTHRITAYTISICGGGISLFFPGYLKLIDTEVISKAVERFYPIDLYLAEAFNLGIISTSGLFSISVTLMIIIFLLFYKEKTTTLKNTLLGIATLTLALIHTYDIFTIVGVSTLWLGYKLFSKKSIKPFVNRYIIIVIGCILPALYFIWLFNLDPILNGWKEQNVLHLPVSFAIISGFGLLIPLSIFGIYLSIKEKNNLWILLSIWLMTTATLSLLPSQFQRKIMEGISIPITLLSTKTLIYFFEGTIRIKSSTIKYIAQGLFINIAAFLLFLTPFYIQTYYVYDIGQKPFPLFLNNQQQEALTFIKNNIQENEVILAPRPYGQIIPGLTHKKSYHADSHQTINWEEKTTKTFIFWKYNNSIEWKEQFLEQENISYVVEDKINADDTEFNQTPGKHANLSKIKNIEPIFENSEIKIYKRK